METFDPVKRESGGNPERTRRCDKGAAFPTAVMQAVVGHWETGKMKWGV